MGEALIIQKMEGFSATITVTYPRGSCNLTGEGQNYSHSGGGAHTFTVKKKGTYTVTATSGSISKSSTVSITKLGEAQVVTLSYVLYLFNKGTISPLITGWNGTGHAWQGINKTSSYQEGGTLLTGSTLHLKANLVGASTAKYWNAGTSNSISLKGYNKLYFNITGKSSSSVEFRVGVASYYETHGFSGWTATATPTSTGTVSVNISSVDSGLIGMGIHCTSSSQYPFSGYITVDQIWLDV